MAEADAPEPDQQQKVGAVLGRMLYHALQGRCIVTVHLPDEHFFLDYIVNRVGSGNFTLKGK